MGQRRLDTLGDIGRYGLLVLFRCTCGRETRYNPHDLIQLLRSSGRGIETLKGKCGGCGKTGVRAVIDPHSVPGQPMGSNII